MKNYIQITMKMLNMRCIGIDNNNKDFNELSELKKLPMTETKKQMVRQALDTATIFFKVFK